MLGICNIELFWRPSPALRGLLASPRWSRQALQKGAQVINVQRVSTHKLNTCVTDTRLSEQKRTHVQTPPPPQATFHPLWDTCPWLLR